MYCGTYEGGREAVLEWEARGFVDDQGTSADRI